MKVLIPFSGDIITPGHIKFIEAVRAKYKHPTIIISLLRNPYGNKKFAMSYMDRKYIIKSLRCVDRVVPQESLNPYNNLIKTWSMAIASGDGWEKEELEGIKKWQEYHRRDKDKLEKKVGCEYEDSDNGIWEPQVLNIQLPGERKGQKLYASSKIKNKIKSSF